MHNVEEVRWTELGESLLDIATYVMGQLERHHIPEPSEVKLVWRWWCRSLHAGLEVTATSILGLH